MNIIMTGPPGAGKGTMSRFIEKYYNVPIISTGEILREEIKNNTILGKTAQALMERGDLVPNNVVIEIIKNVIKGLHNGYLLDGFPRNLCQAIEFDKMLRENYSKIDVVINIEVSDNIIIDRVNKRLVCPKCSRSFNRDYARPINEDYCDICNVKLDRRKDDTEENIKNRLEIYHRETKPLIDYYKDKEILVNVQSGANDINETFEKIRKILG